MKTVYISGAITGHRFFRLRFAIAEIRLKAEGYNVINPAKINAQMPKSTTYDQYMAVCMVLLPMADIIYMLKGWDSSKGANMEFNYALTHDITILEE